MLKEVPSSLWFQKVDKKVRKVDKKCLPVAKLVREHFVDDLRVVVLGEIVVAEPSTDVVLGE